MTEPAVFSPAALRDVREAVAWIAKDSLSAAQAFRDVTIEAARRVGRSPAMGARRPNHGADRFRFHGMRRFPYLLVYNANVTPPRIVRVCTWQGICAQFWRASQSRWRVDGGTVGSRRCSPLQGLGGAIRKEIDQGHRPFEAASS